MKQAKNTEGGEDDLCLLFFLHKLACMKHSIKIVFIIQV